MKTDGLGAHHFALLCLALILCRAPALASGDARDDRSAPAPYGALPSEAQRAWHEMEFYGFLHFTTNTFTDREWGHGDESPAVFAPTAFDADQIVSALAAAGMRGVILTAKHHDGFCLWDSAHTTHDITASPFGRDVVRAIADACRRRNMAFGVYLSPWDRNHAEYGRQGYRDAFKGQLTELLTNYGPIFEVWFDGANGGDGYYGGARESRLIDRASYYEWEKVHEIVRRLQPRACIFSDAGPEIRWIGNESGDAGDPCWATYSPAPRDGESAAAPGTTKYQEGHHGHRDGAKWMPGEVDVSIRPGWFYHAAEDDRVRSPENLVNLWYGSVGRGASLLLNVPPDRRGQIHEKDAAALKEMGRILRETFEKNLAHGATITATATRPGFTPDLAIDDRKDTFWSTPDDVRSGDLVIEFAQPTTLSVISVREAIALGQRVHRWAIDAEQHGAWREIAAGESIGARRIWRGAPVTTTRLRLRFTGPVCPAISDVSVHLEPDRATTASPP